MVRNTTPVKKSNIVAENAQNSVFAMYIFFEKEAVNVWQRSIVPDVRKSAFKSLVLSVKKYHSSTIQKVILYAIKFIFIKFI